MSKKILILGANGFIGSSLTRTILTQKDWQVFGMDIGSHKLDDSIGAERFKFVEGDVTINREWIEYHVKKCDVVIPLVAIANPSQYTKNPIGVFELDFEANLHVVRLCVKYGKRLIFPSTSEVYGMCPDAELDELTSTMVYGPIHKQRWIYAASKQLLDRVIYAYGVRDNLDYTLFRPFNWIGPKLDDMTDQKEGNSRLFTQLISNVMFRKPIQLVDGGTQRRSFTYIDDGIDALLRIIENDNWCATREIFNIGNPANDVSVIDLAEMILAEFEQHAEFCNCRATSPLNPISSTDYFGTGYQDIQVRVPNIDNARADLKWEPKWTLAKAITSTVRYHLEHRHRTPR